ncbi:hypothetical protein AB1Y20_008955 [Prymnesium parvum]|uniref:Protein kinase domain-containing protein n=1 Tax=Prymnesium parvum TaxID=97485 RepID=A0AB34K542_PRYPA
MAEAALAPLGVALESNGLSVGGGYGYVVFGVINPPGSPVAVKVQPANAAAQREREVKLRLEAAPHPNIIAMLGEAQHDGRHYLVMELAERSLFDLLSDTTALAEQQLRPLFAQAVAGVRHLHANGIAHRDLKLENLLLRGTELKIIDFGISHLYARHDDGSYSNERLMTRVGTKSYIPPELYQQPQLPYDGHLYDVWTLGVVLFSLAAGFFPFDRAHLSDLRYATALRAQETMRSVSLVLFSLCERECPFSFLLRGLIDAMLAIEPTARLTLPEVLEHAWLTQDAALPAAPPPADSVVAPPAESAPLAYSHAAAVHAQTLSQLPNEAATLPSVQMQVVAAEEQLLLYDSRGFDSAADAYLPHYCRGNSFESDGGAGPITYRSADVYREEEGLCCGALQLKPPKLVRQAAGPIPADVT